MHDKPMIFGSTRDEDKLFMFANDAFVERPLAFLRPVSEYFDLYVKPKDPKFYDVYARYMAESWKYGAVDLPSDFSFYTADPWACLGLGADGVLPYHLRRFDSPTPKRLPPQIRLMLSHCIAIVAERMVSTPESEAVRWFALWHILPRHPPSPSGSP